MLDDRTLRKKVFVRLLGSPLTIAPFLLGMICGGAVMLAAGTLIGEWSALSLTGRSFAALVYLTVAGIATMSVGIVLGVLGICPVVKRIWTPSWTLYSGGWSFLFLAVFAFFNSRPFST